MKVVLFSGSHSRHLYVMQRLIGSLTEVVAVVMRRENEEPSCPDGYTKRDQDLFSRHFSTRYEVEMQAFGRQRPEEVFSDVETLWRNPSELNNSETAQFISRHQPDVCLIFGVDLIKDPVLRLLPEVSLNMHLGLSPWYKGSATLFWPFFFMQPQWAGVTIHKIVKEADAGEVVLQSTPTLLRGMGIHDVGVEAVRVATEDLCLLTKRLQSMSIVIGKKQRTPGRLFLVKDFEPHHLRTNYEIFDDRMTEAWLSGDLGGRLPKIIRSIDV